MAPPQKIDRVQARAQVQAYSNCTAMIGKTPTSLVNWSAPAGERRVNLADLRCLLLTENRLDIDKRVLELPNYLDCRYERAEAFRNEIINAAVKAYGGTDSGFLNEILAEIDEASESADRETVTDSAQLSWLANLINSIKSGWPRDPTARAALGDSVQFSSQLVGAIANIIATAVPGAAKYKDDVVLLLRTLVDMIFFVGDYVTEVEAIRQEIGVRLLSYSDIKSPANPYGIGRVQTVRGAYAATYGGNEPSMATVRSWCRVGFQLGKPYLAPDGTDGSYQAALALWEAQNRQVKIQTPKMVEAFQGSYPRFIAANVIYGAILNGYSFADAQKILMGIKAYATGVSYGTASGTSVIFAGENISAFSRAPFDGASSLLFQSAAIPGDCGGPKNEWQAADTVVLPDPNAAICGENYFAPFWEDTPGNWGWSINPDIRREKAYDYKRSILDAMLFRYFLISGNAIQRPWRRDDFSRDIWAVHTMWREIVKEAFPYLGSTKRQKKIKETLAARWEVLTPMVRDARLMPPPASASWERLVRKVLMGEEIGVPMPVPNDPKYATTKAPCPDGTTKCLPCDVIKGRRPLGAKVIDIPLVVEWTPPSFVTLGTTVTPFMSPEYAAWRKNLRDNGYPDYYIDCVARDLTFVRKSDVKVISNLTLSGAQGLRAPSVALLTGSNRLGATLKRFDQPGLSQEDAVALARVMRSQPAGVPTALKVGAGLLIAALVIRGIRSGA